MAMMNLQTEMPNRRIGGRRRGNPGGTLPLSQSDVTLDIAINTGISITDDDQQQLPPQQQQQLEPSPAPRRRGRRRGDPSLCSSAPDLSNKARASAAGRTLLGRPRRTDRSDSDLRSSRPDAMAANASSLRMLLEEPLEPVEKEVLEPHATFTASSADTPIIRRVSTDVTPLKSCMTSGPAWDAASRLWHSDGDFKKNEVFDDDGMVPPPPSLSTRRSRDGLTRKVSFSQKRVREYEVSKSSSTNQLGWRYDPREMVSSLDDVTNNSSTASAADACNKNHDWGEDNDNDDDDTSKTSSGIDELSLGEEDLASGGQDHG